eukprot:CAMPEP_0116029274 /NCGR_PEP_ID=MMETSP0321-20121206/16045_1 /TAXON_ID=163516 /ORGANISM="Leptocylindrus danicus var. danicus, Strain B650" /LENGTH=445 /DNA_ID=CAMNT_0003503625 /DNA_START=119 /DNA_END=1453 /DNA_ORIENTATION=-
MKAYELRAWAVLAGSLLHQHAMSAKLVELDQPFKKAPQHNANLGAMDLISKADNTTAVYSALVLEGGEVVAEFYRDDSFGTERRNMFGCAKTWTGLIVGMLRDTGDIDLDETLGEIFKDDAESGEEYKDMWDSIGEAEEKKNISIRQLLSMTSGLAGTSLNSGGHSLASALRQDDFIPPSGVFRYLHSNNIISFVILKKTNESLEKLAGDRIFPYLGINKFMDIAWQKTVKVNPSDENTNYAFHGMSISALNAAKLGQLILQEGRYTSTISTAPLVSSSWVTNMTTPRIDQNGNGPNENLFNKYGYLMQVGKADVFNGHKVSCAYGVGQYICIYPDLDRVFVCQTQFETSFGSDYAIKVSEMDFSTPVPVAPTTPAPTRLPTGAPSTSPPTINPTALPTVTSSANPTSLPSINPSMRPSRFPTGAPTIFPSKESSRSPSERPTVW